MLSGAVHKALNTLPAGLRFSLIRRNISIPRLMTADSVVFKIAENAEEFAGALKLLHDSYVRAGLMDRHPAGLRCNIYQTLPFSTVLIAKVGKHVVGTVALIQDSPIGFPSDAAFKSANDKLRIKGRVAEVSALAIDPRFRNRSHQLSLYLMKFAYNYAAKYLELDYFCASVHPRAADFYIALFGFIKLGDVDSYGYVKNKPGTHLMAEFSSFKSWMSSMYRNASYDRNLSLFMLESSESQLQYPLRDHVALMDPVMTPELLEIFYIKRTDVLLKATPQQLELVYSAYSPFFDLESIDVFKKVRAVSRPFRHPVNISCTLTARNGSLTVLAKIVDLSASGAYVQTELPLTLGETYDVRFRMDGEMIQVPLVPRWVNKGNRIQVKSGYGCQFLVPVEAVTRSIAKAYEPSASRSKKTLKKARGRIKAA